MLIYTQLLLGADLQDEVSCKSWQLVTASMIKVVARYFVSNMTHKVLTHCCTTFELLFCGVFSAISKRYD
jgi:hypothetical protein